MRVPVVGLIVAAAVSGCVDAPEPVAQRPPEVRPRPIVDVHLHAFPADLNGAEAVDQSVGAIDFGFRAPATNQANLDATLAVLREHNVVRAVVSGRLPMVREWTAADPGRFIPGVNLGDPIAGHALEDLSPEMVAAEVAADRLAVLGEITTQYIGLSPNDPILEPYFAVAEELDVPVHIHTAGVGAPKPGFRSVMGQPLLLEDVLVQHPTMRMYLENAGYPFLDQMIALFFQYPDRVYADISTLIRIVPSDELYRYVRTLVEAGYGDRLMFGSDQGVWPQTIGVSIEIMEAASFLTEDQKQAFFCGNAARFLQLDDAVCNG